MPLENILPIEKPEVRGRFGSFGTSTVGFRSMQGFSSNGIASTFFSRRLDCRSTRARRGARIAAVRGLVIAFDELLYSLANPFSLLQVGQFRLFRQLPFD